MSETKTTVEALIEDVWAALGDRSIGGELAAPYFQEANRKLTRLAAIVRVGQGARDDALEEAKRVVLAQAETISKLLSRNAELGVRGAVAKAECDDALNLLSKEKQHAAAVEKRLADLHIRLKVLYDFDVFDSHEPPADDADSFGDTAERPCRTYQSAELKKALHELAIEFAPQGGLG